MASFYLKKFGCLSWKRFLYQEALAIKKSDRAQALLPETFFSTAEYDQ